MNNIIITAVISVLFGIILTYLFELILKSNKTFKYRYYNHHKIIWGYHVHHSTYGLVFMLVGVVLFLYGNENSALDAFLFGLGIIIQHTNSDGRFVFIEKQGNKRL